MTAGVPGAPGAPGSTGGLVLFFSHSAIPDIAGYESLGETPAGNAQADESVTVKDTLGQVLVDPYVTYVGTPGLAILPAGLWRFRTFHYVNDGAGVTTAVFKVYNRTAGGTETLLFTVTSDEINAGTSTEYLTNYAQVLNYPVSITDRLVIKVYGQTTGASNKIFHFVYDGTTDTSHVQTPLLLAEPTVLTFAVRAGENLKDGQAVYISGASGDDPVVSLADNTVTNKARVVGLITTDLASGTVGTVRRSGVLTNVDTRSTNSYVNPNAETWSAGDLLFATTGCGMTNVRPTSGRSVKAAYTILGSNSADILLAYPMENPVWVTAASNENVVLRLGDNSGATKVSVRSYDNTEKLALYSNGTISLGGLAGTKIYYVSDSSGGAVTRKLTFVNGLLVSET
jgi:hypothetical protein